VKIRIVLLSRTPTSLIVLTSINQAHSNHISALLTSTPSHPSLSQFSLSCPSSVFVPHAHCGLPWLTPLALLVSAVRPCLAHHVSLPPHPSHHAHTRVHSSHLLHTDTHIYVDVLHMHMLQNPSPPVLLALISLPSRPHAYDWLKPRLSPYHVPPSPLPSYSPDHSTPPQPLHPPPQLVQTWL